MLNEELLKMDRAKIPKEQLFKKIEALENTIRKFKHYDEERTKLLNKIQEDLEEYSEKYLALRDLVSGDTKFLKLTEKIKNLRINLGSINKKYIQLKKEMELIGNSELIKKADYIINHYKVVDLKNKCDSLDKEIKKLRQTNSELVGKIVQLNNKLKKYEN